MKKLSFHIGINNYPGQALYGCINDASDWAKVMASRGFDQNLIIDSEATRKNILKYTGEFLNSLSTGDQFVLTFSGHGSQVKDDNHDEIDGKDEIICPYDIMQGQFIRDDDFFGLFSIAEARGVNCAFFCDSCFSGTISRAANHFEVKGKPRFMNTFGIEMQDIKSPMFPKSKPSCLLISGCSDSQFSYDTVFKGRPNGAFTRNAIDTLKTMKPDATFLQWYGAIRKKLPTKSYPQTPNLYGDDSQKNWKIF